MLSQGHKPAELHQLSVKALRDGRHVSLLALGDDLPVPRERVVRLTDIKMRVLEWKGPPGGVPVVLLPATGETAEDWGALAGRLRSTRTVYAVDVRGHGGRTGRVTTRSRAWLRISFNCSRDSTAVRLIWSDTPSAGLLPVAQHVLPRPSCVVLCWKTSVSCTRGYPHRQPVRQPSSLSTGTWSSRSAGRSTTRHLIGRSSSRPSSRPCSSLRAARPVRCPPGMWRSWPARCRWSCRHRRDRSLRARL